MKREKLWIVGLLLVIVGGFLAAFPILGMFTDLSPYFFGIFISGMAVVDFGVLFAIVCLYASEEEKKTKVKTVIVVAVTIYLLLLGYLLWIEAMHMPKFEWEVRALVVFNHVIFGTFTFANYNVFLATLFSFGFFVLPFAIQESGILDNYPDEPLDPDVE